MSFYWLIRINKYQLKTNLNFLIKSKERRQQEQRFLLFFMRENKTISYPTLELINQNPNEYLCYRPQLANLVRQISTTELKQSQSTQLETVIPTIHKRETASFD